MNYFRAFQDSDHLENSYDPQGRFGLMLAEQARSDDLSIIDLLIQIEDEIGCSIFEAARRERERQREDRTFN